MVLVLFSTSVACGSGDDEPPQVDPKGEEPVLREDHHVLLREQLESFELEPLKMPPARSEAKIALGRALFHDPIMSGSRDSACVTCHRPEQATVDGLSLPVGTAARVDPETGARTPGFELDYVPRNVPDLFNRGHEQTTSMFWDTRLEAVEVAGEARFRLADTSDSYSPDNYLRLMPEGLDNILAAQNMLPVLNRLELRGSVNSVDSLDPNKPNELATVHDGDFEEVWRKVMKRLLEVEGYRQLFAEAYPDIPLEELTFVQAANGISAFIISSFTFIDSPWDRFIAGDDSALTVQQARGARLFYGKARCASCHTGELFTDNKFHNIGARPIGRGPDKTEFMDRGAAHRSIAGSEGSFAFRTAPLRNVELTPPYMHNGIYNDLESVVRHKTDIKTYLWSYDYTQLRPEFERLVHHDPERLEVVEMTLSPILVGGVDLTEQEIQDIVAFLHALTSPSARDLSHTRPESVPSGLEIPNPPPPREVGEADSGVVE
jgi:cytochrome c peroxidase